VDPWARQQQSVEGSLRPPRVLIVDDMQEWLSLLSATFQRCGFDVVAVTTASQARTELRDQRFDLALIDLILDPYDHRAVGLGVVDALEQLGDPTYILVYSAASSEDLGMEKFHPSPSIEFMRKSEITPTTVTNLLSKIRNRPELFSQSSPPASQTLRDLWLQVLGASDNKGKLLEEFAARFLSSVPNFELVERNYRTASSEIDLVYVIHHDSKGIFHDWGTLILVECRNLSKPVDAKAIRDFSRKVQNADARVGIVLSPRGVTGRNNANAVGEIRSFFIETKRRILVLDRQDIQAYLEGSVDAIHLLDRADRRVRLSA
jgi:CheY-like chemotaxis protein